MLLISGSSGTANMGLFQSLFGKRVPKTNIKQRFDLLEQVGKGTMSDFWRARDRKSGRQIGLKLLDLEQTKKFEARFPGMNKPSEGEIAVQLEHPHIVRTLEHGLSTDGRPFLVMEYIDGKVLGELIPKQPDRVKTHRLRWMLELGEATAYLHAKNFIHRDLCPRNVIITENGRVKLIDFGLVVPNTEPFRRPGNRTGTANYMAPELIRRRPTDQRIDVFSYAVTCYEICSGQLPNDRKKTREAGLLQDTNTPPTDLLEVAPDIDPAIAQIIMKGLETDPNQRWQSINAMLAELRAAIGERDDISESTI